MAVQKIKKVSRFDFLNIPFYSKFKNGAKM